jgi:hypothetical protein
MPLCAFRAQVSRDVCIPNKSRQVSVLRKERTNLHRMLREFQDDIRTRHRRAPNIRLSVQEAMISLPEVRYDASSLRKRPVPPARESHIVKQYPESVFESLNPESI